MITRLSDIIDTGSQAELLAFFLTATPRSFTVPELSHRLKLNSSAIQTAVNSLEKQNILKTFSKNYTRFYILNSKHAMVPDLLASFKKEHKQWPDELTSNLKKLGNLSGIFLSGVFVGRPELVVDLLLVGNVNSARLSQFLKTAQKQFGGELNYSIMSPAEFRIRRDTFDRFIKDVFDYPHIVLVDKSDSSAKPKTTSKKRVVKSINTPKAKPQPKVATKPQAKKSTKKVVTVAKKKVAKVAKKKTAKPAKKVTKKPARKPAPKKVVKKPSRKPTPKKSIKNIRKPAPKKIVKNTSKKTKKKKR